MGLLLWGDSARRRRAGHELDPRTVVSPRKENLERDVSRSLSLELLG